MHTVIKPRRLSPGDTVAIVSPSWAGPSVFPHVYEAGLEALRSLGLRVREMPHARSSPEELHEHPELRAKDLNLAFRDTDVRAIIASIGGDDSIRILPHLDVSLALRDPKIVMGYSDNTTLLVTLAHAGLVTFHGPVVMAGFAQLSRFPASYLEHLRAVLFRGEAPMYPPYGEYTEKYLDWSSHTNEIEALRPDPGMKVIQGARVVSGRLFGGCIEVLDFLRGTRFLRRPTSFVRSSSSSRRARSARRRPPSAASSGAISSGLLRRPVGDHCRSSAGLQ